MPGRLPPALLDTPALPFVPCPSATSGRAPRMSLWLARAVPPHFDRKETDEIDPSPSLQPAAGRRRSVGGPAAPRAGSGPRYRAPAEAAPRAAQGQAEARAGARGERDRAQEGAEGGGQGRAPGDLRQKGGEVGRRKPSGTLDRGAHR